LNARTGSDDVVLAYFPVGNYGVAHSDARFFLGHPYAIVDLQGKEQAVRAFYSSEATDADRRQLVTSYGITYVYYGTHEQELGHYRPAETPWLAEVYKQGKTAVYRVQATAR
jgi:uncharacterized membrane protein